jgi:hypothetical protein
MRACIGRGGCAYSLVPFSPADLVEYRRHKRVKGQRPDLQEIKYTADMDMVLLISVNESGAHIARHGNAAKLYETVAIWCRSSMSRIALHGISQLPLKTL